MPSVPRLLVMSCSARKRKDLALLPALERYDGPAFRVLRKYLSTARDPLRVLVLSARFGLIEGSYAIPDYDQRLTVAAAQAMRSAVLQSLVTALDPMPNAELAFCLGKDYREAVAGHWDVVPVGTTVTFISGSQGTRLRNLRAWLERTGSDPDSQSAEDAPTVGS